MACDNLSGWPTASKVHFVTYRLNSSSVQVAGTQLDCTGIVTGNNIGSISVIDGTDTGNSVNDVVEMIPTAAWGQDLADALTKQHSRTGAHVGINNTGGLTTDTLTVTSGSTLPAGDIATADLANASVTADKLSTGAQTATVLTSETTTSASYTDLATTTDTVTTTIGANGIALVALYSSLANNTTTTDCNVGFAISGATTQAATDTYSIDYQTYTANAQGSLSAVFLLTGLSAGSSTFKMKYKVGAGTGTFKNRRISVVPL